MLEQQNKFLSFIKYKQIKIEKTERPLEERKFQQRQKARKQKWKIGISMIIEREDNIVNRNRDFFFFLTSITCY